MSSLQAEPSPRKGRRRWRWILLVSALLVLAVGSHVWFWYVPRGRISSPDRSDLPARLAAASDASLRVWLAYPHQNLGALSREQPAIAQLWRQSLPPFAIFPAPPARELALAWDDEGGVAAARVFPSVALLAKAAGRLAGNPWLSGGRVSIGGLPGVVEWRGRLWTAAWGNGELPDDGSSGRGSESAESGADDDTMPEGTFAVLVRLEPERLGFDVPARRGWWSAEGREDRLRLTRVSPRSAPAEPPAPLLAAETVDPLIDEAPDELGLLAIRDAGSFAEALFVMDHPAARGVVRLPSAALATAGAKAGERGLELPARELYEALGARYREESVGAWGVLATDRQSAEIALRLLAPIVATPVPGSAEGWFVALRPRAVHRLARGVDDVFDTLPLGSRDVRRRWRRYREWSEALLPIEWLGLSIEPDRIEIRSRSTATTDAQ